MTHDAPAAFQATFCGFRSVGSRKVVAMTFEVPVEYSERVLKITGHPDSMNPKWFAIALLTEEAAAKAQGAQAPVSSKPVPTKDRRDWSQLTYAEQAGIKCEDRAFQRFLQERHQSVYGATDGNAADIVRYICGVKSRSEIVCGTASGDLWEDLLSQYDAWRLV